MEITAQNAIYLGEETGGKGRQFKARFLVPGLVKYDYGVCLLTKENADKFIQGFTGCPVIINHQTVTDQNVKDIAVGDIFSVWFDEKDGYYWCNGILRDKEAIKLINEGYSVSCQYLITEYSDNTSGALHNGNPYDKVIENGKPEHLAIVNNPRYEGAIIAVNALLAENEDKWITIHPNGEENKGRHLLLRDGESPAEAVRRVYGDKNQKTLFDTKEYKKTKEDFKKEAEEKQKQIKDYEKSAQKRRENLEHLGVEDPDNLEDLSGDDISFEEWEDKKADTKQSVEEKQSKDLYSDENFKYNAKRLNEQFGEKPYSEWQKDVQTMLKKYGKTEEDWDNAIGAKKFIKQSDKEEKGEPNKKIDTILKDYSEYFNKEQLEEFKQELEKFDKYKGLDNIDIEGSKKSIKDLKPEEALKRLKDSNNLWARFEKEDKLKKRFYDYVDKNDFKDQRVNELARFIGGFEKLGLDKPITFEEMKNDPRYGFKIELALKYLADKKGFDNYSKDNEEDRIKAGFDKFIEIVYGKSQNKDKKQASNSFVEQFKDTLYTVLAEKIYNRLGELLAQNRSNNPKEKWVTIKGNHILLKDGESLADAFQRVTGVSLQKSNNPKDNTDLSGGNRKYKEALEKVKRDNEKKITPQQIIDSAIKSLQESGKKYTPEEIKAKISDADDYNLNIVRNNWETYKYHSDGKGHYKENRQKLHKKILNDLFLHANMAKPKDGEKPTFMVLGGRGGSGKSKFDMPNEKNPGNIGVYDKSKYIVLDADAIKEMLPEYKGYNAFEVHEESSDILKKALKIAQKRGLNVVLDGTMKSFGSTEKKIKSFKDAGYNIEMYYMHLPREKAAERAIGRFMGENGRYVPLEILLDMKNNEENFDKLKKYASKWAFYNNDVPSKENKPILIDKNY